LNRLKIAGWAVPEILILIGDRNINGVLNIFKFLFKYIDFFMLFCVSPDVKIVADGHNNNVILYPSKQGLFKEWCDD